MNAFGARMGYILGLTVAIPLLIFIVNFFFLKGNNLSEKQIDDYIQNSEIITIDIPKDAIYTHEQFTPKLRRGNSGAFLHMHTFYSEAYQKHFVLVTFTDFEKNDQVRLKIILFKNIKTTAHVNKKQLASAEYGTAQKPIPIFPLDLLETNGQSAHPDNQKFFHLSDTTYRLYVQYYLNRFIEKEDIEKLFKK